MQVGGLIFGKKESVSLKYKECFNKLIFIFCCICPFLLKAIRIMKLWSVPGVREEAPKISNNWYFLVIFPSFFPSTFLFYHTYTKHAYFDTYLISLRVVIISKYCSRLCSSQCEPLCLCAESLKVLYDYHFIHQKRCS